MLGIPRLAKPGWHRPTVFYYCPLTVNDPPQTLLETWFENDSPLGT